MTEAHPSPKVAVIAVGPDSTNASWLSRALSRWRTPRNLVRHGRVSRRVEVVDPDEASFLVVVCSPRAKDDEHIASAVRTFGARADRDRVIALLVDGEPADAFPPALYRQDGSEPLAADVRVGTSARRRTELLRIVAPMLGCSYDDLRRRDQERRVRRLGVAAGVGLGVAALLGVLSVYALQQASAAEASRRELEETRTRADRVNRFVSENLFVPLNALDRLDILRPSTEAQMAFYRDLPMPTDTAEREWRVLAMRRHAVVLSRQGEIDAAREMLEAELEVLRGFRDQEPSATNWKQERIFVLDLLAEMLGRLGEPERELAVTQVAADEAVALVAAEPSPQNHGFAALALTQLGRRLHGKFDHDGAEAAYAAAEEHIDAVRASDASSAQLEADLEAARAILDSAHGNMDRADERRATVVALRRQEAESGSAAAQSELASALANFGDWRRMRGDLESAKALLEEGYAMQRRLAAQDPTNAVRRTSVANCAMGLSRVLREMQQDERADELAREALAEYRRLRAISPDRTAVLNSVYSAAHVLAWARRDDGDAEEARTLLDEALDATLDGSRADPTGAQWLVQATFVEINITEVLAAAGENEQALLRIGDAERHAARALDVSSDNPVVAGLLAPLWTRIAGLLGDLGQEERAAAARLWSAELALRELEHAAADGKSDR